MIINLGRGSNKEEVMAQHWMNVPTRIVAQRLPIVLPFRGVRKFALLTHLQQISSHLRSGFPKNMAWSLENKTGLVRPATDAYVAEAIEALKAGKVIALPTDTLYGFACDAWCLEELMKIVYGVPVSSFLAYFNKLTTEAYERSYKEVIGRPKAIICSSEAVNRIYEIKGRKHTSPLAICVGDVSDINPFAVTNNLPHGLLDSLLPGPVTVVLSRGESSVLEKSLNPGFDSIGVRVPDCDFIRAIACGSGTALALTSANLSGQSSSVCIKDFENLWEHCTFVYDGGLLPSGRAGSTVMDLSIPHKYKILRPGSAKEETVAILEKHSLVEAATT